MVKSKPGAILKLRLVQLSELDDSEMVELPAGSVLVTDGMEQGHYRVIGYVWKDSVIVDGEWHLNEDGIELIKEFEGLKLRAYRCSGNVPTIGYGTTRINGKPVKMGTLITKDEADSLFREDIKTFEDKVRKRLKELGLNEFELNSSQFSALVSLCYNCGLAPLDDGNTIAEALKERDFDKAASGFLLWNRANGRVLSGLVRRRQAEHRLFNQLAR